MAEFDVVLEEYIREHPPVEAIEGYLESHHLLAARRDVIRPALRAYERGELALFVSGVAVQIEGIFEDACKLSGVSVDTLRTATLVPKLDSLLQAGHVRLDYAYYAFKFPILRNRIAHGRLVSDELRRVSRLLLLDVQDACRVVARHPGVANSLVELLRRVRHPTHATVEDSIHFAVLYSAMEGVGPDVFYGLHTEFEAMKAVLDRPKLWTAFRECLQLQDEAVDSGVRYLASILRKYRSSLEAESRSLLSALGQRGSDQSFDREEFLANARQLTSCDELVHTDSEIRETILDVLHQRTRHLRIAERAYEIWNERGRQEGRHLDDWLDAEREISVQF